MKIMWNSDSGHEFIYIMVVFLDEITIMNIQKLVLVLSILISGNLYGQSEQHYIEKASKYYENGDYENSILYCDKAISIRPDGLTYGLRGLAKAGKMDFMGAISDYNKAIEISPKLELGYPYLLRAAAKSKLKDYRGALLDIELSIRFGYIGYDVYYEKGCCKMFLKEFENAILDFNKAISLNNKYPKSYTWRGLCKVLINDKNGGCLDFSKAGELGDAYAYKCIKEYCQ